MTTMEILALAAFLSLVCVMSALFISLIAGSIVWVWWRAEMTMVNGLPRRVEHAIAQAAAQYIQPLEEVLDDRGNLVDRRPVKRTPLSDEELEKWLA